MANTNSALQTGSTSVERAFAILETFEREKRPLSLKELAEFCRIPASTCHSLVHTLLKRSYIYQAGRRKDLYPTRRLYDMGAVLVAHDRLLQRFLPAMERLREQTGETIILGERQQDSILYLEVLEGPQAIRYSARAGNTKPLHSSAIGKTALGAMGDDEIRELLARLGAPAGTANTITTADALIADIQRGRSAGVFVTRGENVADVTAVAVPVSLHDQLFGLAIAGPSHRMEPSLAEWTKLLLDASRLLIEPAGAD